MRAKLNVFIGFIGTLGGLGDARATTFDGTVRTAGGGAWYVTNPSEYFEDGESAELWVRLFTPSGSTGALPTVVLVPGGDSDSTSFTGRTSNGWVRGFVAAGFAVVVFDPQGRGHSTGTEDDNGYEGQDGLAEVIRFIGSLPRVDDTKIGLVSNSYGVSLASGVLARHADLPLEYFIDWEGPADRTDTAGCVGHDDDGDGIYDWYTEQSYSPSEHAPHLANRTTCDDEAFWSEREATGLMPLIGVPYRRFQSEVDHVQADYGHTVKLVNAALASDAPEVFVNDAQVYAAVTETDIAGWVIPESDNGSTAAYLASYAAAMTP